MNSKLPYTQGDPTKAKICLIGEAAGYEEQQDSEKRPFVGSAGRLLDNLLLSSGITRSSCYITNVFKEHPYKNDVSKFITFKKNSFKLTTTGERHVKVLHEELFSCNANVFVPLGRVPLAVILGLTGITKWRGSILETFIPRTLSDGTIHQKRIKIVPTIHPSAAFRNFLYNYMIIHDLKRALAESADNVVRLPKRNFIIKPSFLTAMEYLESCKKLPCIATDIEVSNDELYCFSIAKSATDAISIPMVWGGQNYFTPDQEAEIMKSYGELCENPGIVKWNQNIIFDASFLIYLYGIKVTNMQDTMVAQGILTPDMPKGLDFITSIYTREPYYKDDGKYRNPKVSDYDYAVYSAKDSAIVMEVKDQLLADLKSQGNLETYYEQIKIIEPLLYATQRGINVNSNAMKEAAKEVREKIEEIKKELWELCGYKINPGSPKQVAEYFYVKKKLPKYTKSGSVTTDEKALKRILRKGYKEAALVLAFRHWDKLRGTYLDIEIDPDNRLRCSFNPVGTVNGRISSSKTIRQTGMNMQNQPHSMLKYFMAG